MSVVVGLRGETPTGQPVADVVQLLEELLERARAGELRGIAYATVERDGAVCHGWTRAGRDGGGARGVAPELHGLASGILVLALRYARVMHPEET